MFYRTTTGNIGWKYINDLKVVESWQDWRRGYFADVEEVSDSLALAIADALKTAEELGYFLYPAGSVKGMGMTICAEALFRADSEEEISKILATYRHADPQYSVYKLGNTYYENCQTANNVFHAVTGQTFPAWLYFC